MPLFQGSRYSIGENGKKINASKVFVNGKTITFLHDRKIYIDKDMKEAIQIYEIQQGDLPDLISFLNCGDSTKWFLFADINGLFYPDDEMDKGRVLLMPSVNDFRSV